VADEAAEEVDLIQILKKQERDAEKASRFYFALGGDRLHRE
jgi:hypothetical protein